MVTSEVDFAATVPSHQSVTSQPMIDMHLSRPRRVCESPNVIGPWFNIQRGCLTSKVLLLVRCGGRYGFAHNDLCCAVDFADRIGPSLAPSLERETVEGSS